MCGQESGASYLLNTEYERAREERGGRVATVVNDSDND